ncbi:MAG: hypothetical protein M1381_06420 [Deltaproteobacteria bacterium]|nr:hypothetical protein [Deltaproteobacteria bacterium]
MGNGPLAIIIDFLQPVNPSTFQLNKTFTSGGIGITPSAIISGLQFTAGSFDSTNTELTLWINTSQMGVDQKTGVYYPQVLYTLYYTSGLKTATGNTLSEALCLQSLIPLYGFEAVGSMNGVATVSGYEYGQEFGAISAIAPLVAIGIGTIWDWINGIPSNPGSSVPDASYLEVPPHYPFTTNFNNTLVTPVEVTLEEKDIYGNFGAVDGSQYSGYNNIMFGDWISTFTTLLPYTPYWPGLETFSYTVASATGFDIDTVYKLTYPTLQCNMPSGHVGDQDLMGDPLGYASPIPNCTPSFGNPCYSPIPADQSITFHTSPIRIDNLQSDNVDIPTITAPFTVTGIGTLDIASVGITTTNGEVNIGAQVSQTSTGIYFTSNGGLSFKCPGDKTIVATGYNVTGTSRGSDFVTINYQPVPATQPYVCSDLSQTLSDIFSKIKSSCGTWSLGFPLCPQLLAHNMIGGAPSKWGVWSDNPLFLLSSSGLEGILRLAFDGLLTDECDTAQCGYFTGKDSAGNPVTNCTDPLSGGSITSTCTQIYQYAYLPFNLFGMGTNFDGRTAPHHTADFINDSFQLAGGRPGSSINIKSISTSLNPDGSIHFDGSADLTVSGTMNIYFYNQYQTCIKEGYICIAGVCFNYPEVYNCPGYNQFFVFPMNGDTFNNLHISFDMKPNVSPVPVSCGQARPIEWDVQNYNASVDSFYLSPSDSAEFCTAFYSVLNGLSGGLLSLFNGVDCPTVIAAVDIIGKDVVNNKLPAVTGWTKKLGPFINLVAVMAHNYYYNKPIPLPQWNKIYGVGISYNGSEEIPINLPQKTPEACVDISYLPFQ